MAKSLTQRYEEKKNNTLAKRPKVGFLLSFEEYCNLINKATVCDYTGLPFTPQDGRSIERIDSSLPYQADNCCCITIRVNQLKAVIDGDTNMTMTKEDLELIAKIRHTLDTKTRFELSGKYNPAVNTAKEISDIDLAKAYIKFCENHKKSTLSLKAYTKLHKKKTCQWSGKKFSSVENDLGWKVYTRPDMSKPFADDNCIVVCLALSAIKKKGTFTKKQLTRFMEIL